MSVCVSIAKTTNRELTQRIGELLEETDTRRELDLGAIGGR